MINFHKIPQTAVKSAIILPNCSSIWGIASLKVTLPKKKLSFWMLERLDHWSIFPTSFVPEHFSKISRKKDQGKKVYLFRSWFWEQNYFLGPSFEITFLVPCHDLQTLFIFRHTLSLETLGNSIFILSSMIRRIRSMTRWSVVKSH